MFLLRSGMFLMPIEIHLCDVWKLKEALIVKRPFSHKQNIYCQKQSKQAFLVPKFKYKSSFFFFFFFSL